MSAHSLQVLSSFSTLFAAVGTVSALFVGVFTFKSESKDRTRADVRGVRAWVEWIESKNYLFAKEMYEQVSEKDKNDKKPPLVTMTPTVHVENGTDDFIYNVVLSVLLPRKFGSQIEEVATLKPHQKQTLGGHVEVDYLDLSRRFKGDNGIRMIFTDSRGIRWKRDEFGKLKRVYPLRWFAPWRKIDPIEFRFFSHARIPRWALVARWDQRWSEFEWRNSFNYPPQFWALDIRWRRWRASQKENPYLISMWNFPELFKSRHEKFFDRQRRHLSTPWFSIDDNVRQWIFNRRQYRLFKREATELDKYSKSRDW